MTDRMTPKVKRFRAVCTADKGHETTPVERVRLGMKCAACGEPMTLVPVEPNGHAEPGALVETR